MGVRFKRKSEWPDQLAMGDWHPGVCYNVDCGQLQVVNALKTIGPDEEVLKADLELRQSLCQAAQALQLTKLRVADLAQIVANVNVLHSQGIVLPVAHRMQITKRFASVSLADGKVLEWQSHVSLVASTHSIATAETEESAAAQDEIDPWKTWSITKPTFAACLADLEAPRAEFEPDNSAEFTESYYGSCLNDAFLKLITRAAEEQVTGLLDVCAAFLVQMPGPGSSQLPRIVETTANSIASIMRGLSALCSPQPGVNGSQLKDVQYIMPKNASSAPILGIPRLGRIIVNKLRSAQVVQSIAQ